MRLNIVDFNADYPFQIVTDDDRNIVEIHNAGEGMNEMTGREQTIYLSKTQVSKLRVAQKYQRPLTGKVTMSGRVLIYEH